jgi:hypothetical protein
MATLIILINLILGTMFQNQTANVNIRNSSTATISGTIDGRVRTIIVQKTNPIILEGDY